MKFIYFVIVMSFILWTCSDKESTEPQLNDGLAAYYPFNGSAMDESGNGNDGMVHGSSLTSDRFGNDSSAYFLDGIDDYIEFPQTFNFHKEGDVSMSFWINHDSTEHQSIFWTRGDDTDKNRFNIYTYYEGKSFGMDYRTSSGQRHKIFSADTKKNAWVFIAIIRKGNQYSLYVDGNEISAITDTAPSLPTYTGKWFCGKRSKYMYHGAIDDIRIYNRALSEEEISNLYHEGGWEK